MLLVDQMEPQSSATNIAEFDRVRSAIGEQFRLADQSEECLSNGEKVLSSLISPPRAQTGVQAILPGRLQCKLWLKRQEINAIAAALKQTNGKVSGPGGAAQLLGMRPTTLSSRIASLGISRRTLN